MPRSSIEVQVRPARRHAVQRRCQLRIACHSTARRSVAEAAAGRSAHGRHARPRASGGALQKAGAGARRRQTRLQSADLLLKACQCDLRARGRRSEQQRRAAEGHWAAHRACAGAGGALGVSAGEVPQTPASDCVRAQTRCAAAQRQTARGASPGANTLRARARARARGPPAGPQSEACLRRLAAQARGDAPEGNAALRARPAPRPHACCALRSQGHAPLRLSRCLGGQ
jgi:hypothetical protein